MTEIADPRQPAERPVSSIATNSVISESSREGSTQFRASAKAFSLLTDSVRDALDPTMW